MSPAAAPPPPPVSRAARRGLGWLDVRTLKLTWPLLLLTPVLLVLVAAGVLAQGVGQIVNTNALRWERAQHGAVVHLARYSDSCDPAHFEAYRADMGALKAFESARRALFAPAADRDAAMLSYQRAGLPAWEARLLVWLLPLLQPLPVHRAVSDIWEQANAVARDIDRQAHTLHGRVLQGCRDPGQHPALLAEVYAVTERLAPLRKALDQAASQARWRLGMGVLVCMAALALPFTGAGYWLTARLQRRAAAGAVALAESEQRLQLALAGSGYGLWELQLGSGAVACSATMMALLGQADREQLLARDSFLGLLHPQDRGTFTTALQARTADGGRLEIEVRLRRQDGGYGWFKLAGRTVPAEGRPAERMIGSVSDITERRAMQRALEEELALRRNALQSLRGALARLDTVEALPGAAQAAHAAPAAASPAVEQTQDEITVTTEALARVGARLREVNERLEAVLALSPDAFVSFDAQQRISLASPAVGALTGLDLAALQGQAATAFFAQLQALSRSDLPLPGLQALLALGDGEPLTLELATQPPRTLSLLLREGSHPKVRHVLCLRDVTHQRQVERLKSEFIAVAAHELRTPMTSIYGFVELMMRRNLGEDARRELYATIHKHCRLMVSILDDLMNLGHLEARQALALQVREIDLRALLRSTARAWPVPAGREAPRLHAAAWPEARVLADGVQLVRVINNVLSNAYKYSPDGGPVDITLTRQPGAAGGADEVCIRIVDQGMGMTPEQLARVGERFYRADGSGHIPGTGLGMSLVMEIVRLHGGQLRLHSDPDVGTQVDVCLPALAARGDDPGPVTVL